MTEFKGKLMDCGQKKNKKKEQETEWLWTIWYSFLFIGVIIYDYFFFFILHTVIDVHLNAVEIYFPNTFLFEIKKNLNLKKIQINLIYF